MGPGHTRTGTQRDGTEWNWDTMGLKYNETWDTMGLRHNGHETQWDLDTMRRCHSGTGTQWAIPVGLSVEGQVTGQAVYFSLVYSLHYSRRKS